MAVAAEAGSGPTRLLMLLNEQSESHTAMMELKRELYRRSSEMPATGDAQDDDDLLVKHGPLKISSRGTVCIERWRTAGPFGWLNVDLPIPRRVYETVGTFSMRPLYS